MNFVAKTFPFFWKFSLKSSLFSRRSPCAPILSRKILPNWTNETAFILQKPVFSKLPKTTQLYTHALYCQENFSQIPDRLSNSLYPSFEILTAPICLYSRYLNHYHSADIKPIYKDIFARQEKQIAIRIKFLKCTRKTIGKENN